MLCSLIKGSIRSMFILLKYLEKSVDPLFICFLSFRTFILLTFLKIAPMEVNDIALSLKLSSSYLLSSDLFFVTTFTVPPQRSSTCLTFSLIFTGHHKMEDFPDGLQEINPCCVWIGVNLKSSHSALKHLGTDIKRPRPSRTLFSFCHSL